MDLSTYSYKPLSAFGELPQSIIERLAVSPLIIGIIGAVVFAIALLLLIILRRRRRRGLTAAPSPQDLTEEKLLESVTLDDLVAMGTDLYQTLGHNIRDVTKPSKDVADLIIDSENGQRWIARCLYKPVINSQEVANFRKAIQKAGIPQSALITSGSFTSEALEEAARGEINTLELSQLIEYLSQAKQMPA
ncbi:MAG: restriction endonuclease [Anaerolineales bacterium]|jgi:hypothetical protein